MPGLLRPDQSKAKGKNKTTELTKDSNGMTALIAAIDAVVTTHKIAVPEVVKAVAHIKRTGLIITNAVRKAKSYICPLYLNQNNNLKEVEEKAFKLERDIQRELI